MRSEDPNSMTSHDWLLWLKEQEESSLNEYRNRPLRLFADRSAEQSFTRDYCGREILELLQNAADAAVEANLRGSVRIELHEEGLLVANTGIPFSTDGVISLRMAHLSSKPFQPSKRKLVGSKGLGFRAVLNWASFPIILSGNLGLAHSEQIARSKQEQLAELSDDLRAGINKYKLLFGSLVVPLLAFPAYADEGNLPTLLDNEAQRRLADGCRRLRKEGFDTVIGMPFDRKDTYETARAQIELLRPELLLFVPGLENVTIVVSKIEPKLWRCPVIDGETVRVYQGHDDQDYLEWTVYRKQGVVPHESPSAGQPRAIGQPPVMETDYEVVLAIPRAQVEPTLRQHTKESDKLGNGHLYSYFPTGVRFPYPVTCHVTLDLVSNRQQPQATPANDFVINELAHFMAEIGERLAKGAEDDAGLRLIVGNPQYHVAELEKFHFRARLFMAAMERALVPTLGAGLLKASDARVVAFSDTKWLPKSTFRNVAKIANDDRMRTVLEENLRVPALIWPAEITFDTMESRAAFVAGIIRHQVSHAFSISGLLIDTHHAPIPLGGRVFLLPVTDRTFSLPSWFDVRFLDSELEQLLMKQLNVKSRDALAASLLPLGVSRYSLDSLLGAMVAQANRKAESEPEGNQTIHSELLKALWTLFLANEPGEDRPQFPKDARVLIRTLGGTYQDARKLYLSESYGIRGRILHDLYCSFAREKLIASPGELNIEDGTEEQFSDFVMWLGVAAFPRTRVIDRPDGDFAQCVKASLPEPIKMEDYVVDSVAQLDNLLFQAIVSIDELTKILNHAPPEAVLAWLCTDRRAFDWKSPSTSHGKVGLRSRGAHRPRFYDGAIPSYIRWKLETTKWLPVLHKQQRAAPRECLAEAVHGLETLLPRPSRPGDQIRQRYGVPHERIRDAFDCAGVLPGFSQITPEQLYELLLSLPLRDPEGLVAKAVYRAVLSHFDADGVSDCQSRKRFLSEGRIWARRGDEHAYHAVAEVLHIDSEDVPTSLCQQFPIAALPKRSNRRQKIYRLFGVQVLERGELIRRVTSHEPIPEGEVFSEEVEQLKPLILALRRGRTQRVPDINALEDLRIVVCSSIVGEIEFRGEVTPLDLQLWDCILDDERHSAYVLADPSEPDLLKSDLLADTVGQVFASVFHLEHGDEFARLITCKRKDRLKLLKRLLGDDELPEMGQLIGKYRESIDASYVEIPDREGVLTPPVLAREPKKAVATPAEAKVSCGKPEEAIGDPPEIVRVGHVPKPRGAGVSERVSHIAHAERQASSRERRVADGSFYEEKAMEFEQCNAPPRFPLRVGHITGSQSPGVDLLSFVSAEHERKFRDGDHSESLVERFIEVKGREDKEAKITLEGNELEAAKKYREKYYLYRISDSGDNRCQIAILKNPLSDATGTRWHCEVDLDAATGTERFEHKGGVSAESYAKRADAQPLEDSSLEEP